MKSRLVLISIVVAIIQQGALAQLECVLGARVYPLQFIGSTKTMEFRTAFKSNCLDYSTNNFFVLSYQEDHKLTPNNHPKKVMLTLFKRHKFVFDFIPTFKLIRKNGNFSDVLYTKFRMPLTRSMKPISAIDANHLILKTAKKVYLSYAQIQTVMMKRNPTLCTMNPTKTILMCNIDK